MDDLDAVVRRLEAERYDNTWWSDRAKARADADNAQVAALKAEMTRLRRELADARKDVAQKDKALRWAAKRQQRKVG